MLGAGDENVIFGRHQLVGYIPVSSPSVGQK